MPFTFFAHQAPVLPLKLARPRWWSGTALVVGSMAPDFIYFIEGNSGSAFGHTLLGQVVFCWPLTLVVVWLLRRVIARPLAANLPDLSFFHLRDYAALDDRTRRALSTRDVASALVGSLSHVALDAFTHRDGWVVERVALLRAPAIDCHGGPVPVYELLQHGGTLAGGALTVLMLAWIGANRRVLAWHGLEDPPALPTAKPVRFWLGVLAGGAAGAVWVFFRLDGELHGIDLAVDSFLRGTLGLFLGLVGASALVLVGCGSGYGHGPGSG